MAQSKDNLAEIWRQSGKNLRTILPKFKDNMAKVKDNIAKM